MTAYIFDRREPTKRLLIASDTMGYTPDKTSPKPLGFSGKVITLPHLRGVLCGRGMMAIGVSAAAHLMAECSLVTFTDAIEALPEILTRVTADYAAQYDITDPDSLMLYEALWAGWNDVEGRAEVVSFRNFEGYEPIRGDAERTMSAIPTLPPEYIPAGLAGLTTERIMIALMQGMRRYLAEHPEVIPAIIGGEIVLTEITAQSVTSRIVHRFPDFEQARHAAAAVRGRLERGEDVIDLESGICRVDEAAEDGVAAAPAVTRSADMDVSDAETSPAPGTGMSRQQRRHAAKLARKGGRRAA